MKADEYNTLYQLERNHWYFITLRNLIFSLLEKRYKSKNDLKILDAGCGTGALLENFAKYGHVLGLDISDHAIFYCKKRNLNNIIQASVCNLPLKDNKFDLVTCVDVLYSLGGDEDLIALKEIYRVLNTSGRLILNLPAYKFLMSEHDKAVFTKNRYTKAEVAQKLELAGFKVERVTYRNTILFPLLVIYRILKKNSKTTEESKSDLKPFPSFLNKILIKTLTLENLILKSYDFPFGSSIFCVAYKP
jgi:ubiquinone/menaquinone biosynthesis C-methylase UbiE